MDGLGRESGDQSPVDQPLVDQPPLDQSPVDQSPVERMWAADRASQGLGIRIGDVGPGRATARLTVTAALLNGHGICHGGYLFLLADTAFAVACNTHGAATVASGADVEFLAPVREGDEVVAEAVERVLRGRSGLYDVTVRRGDEVVVEFRGRSRGLPRAPSAP